MEKICEPSSGRMLITKHHCHECKGAVSARCFKMNHQAFCEAPYCGAQFHPRFGCHKHPYSFAYNLEAQAGFFNRDLSELVDNFNYMLPLDKKTGSAEEKLAIVRKRFEEGMVLPLEPRGLPEKKPTAKEAKSRKWAGKIRRGGRKPRRARE